MTALVGADPEVFIKDKRGRFRSAHGLIPGTKEEPYPVRDGAVQVDGMALEFNINPADNREEFVNNIDSVLSQLAGMVPEYDLVIEPTAKFSWQHMRDQPDVAKELGCEPDFNAYTGRENPRPDNKTTMRTAAGHVHIGFVPGCDADVRSEEHMIRCIMLVKHLDIFLGLPSLCWDKDQKRRSMYGKAGCFRPKPYGVEYRTLSNAWLKSPKLVGYVFDRVQQCVEYLLSGGRLTEYYALRNARLRINQNNWGYADGLLHREYLRARFPAIPLPPIIR